MTKQITVIVFFTFLLSGLARADDWVVPKSWSVQEQEITFESEGYRLSGTLYWPKGSDKVAAVVIPQQAGTALRSHVLYQQKVRLFNSLGYAAFVYDRRGAGESEGPETRPTYDSLAADAVAAKRRIASHEVIDPEQIGFWGLSQSGWIVMLAANNSEPAFSIVVNSSLTTPEEQMDILTFNYVRLLYGEEAAEKALSVRQIVMTDYFEGDVEYEEVQKQIRSVQDEPWFQYVYILKADDFPEDISITTWQKERVFDPMNLVKGLSTPTLLMFGGKDIDTPIKRSLELIEEEGFDETVEVVVIPDADHVMRHFKHPSQRSVDDEFHGAEVPEYFAYIGAWLTKTLANADNQDQ